MRSDQLRRLIRETLKSSPPNLYSLAAENLLLGTAAHESGGFEYLYQVNGPALGFFQMEPATLDDLYTHYLAYKPELRHALEILRPRALKRHEALSGCLAYSIVAARLHYYRFPEPMPENAHDIEQLAALYKRRWNTTAGKATETDFIDAYARYVKG